MHIREVLPECTSLPTRWHFITPIMLVNGHLRRLQSEICIVVREPTYNTVF